MNVSTQQLEPIRSHAARPTVRLRSSAVLTCPGRDAFASVASWTYPETGAVTSFEEAKRISGIQGAFQGTSVENGGSTVGTTLGMASDRIQAKAFDVQYLGSVPGGPPA